MNTINISLLVFKPEESRPARALAYAPNLRGDDSRPHRYRHMLRGSVEGVIGGSFNNGSGRASIDEDEKAADDVSNRADQKVFNLNTFVI